MIKSNRTFVTIFERYEEIHKNKDVGQLSEVVGNFPGWNSEIWGESTFSDFKLKKIKLFHLNLHAVLKLLFDGKNINVLNLYHLRYYNIAYAIIYKFINPKGFVYLKGDFNRKKINEQGFLHGKSKLALKFVKKFINKVDLISSEHESILSKIEDVGISSIYLPNSPSVELSKFVDNRKNNEVSSEIVSFLFVGRVGDPNKNVELLLETLSILDGRIDFQLKVLGPIRKEFQDNLDNNAINIPNNVEFLGMVTDLDKIAAYYVEADMLVMTSHSEGFPLCAVEAAYARCALLVNRNCGVDELVEDKVNGYYYADRDDLIDKLEHFCNLSREEIEILKRNSEEKAAKMHWFKTIPPLMEKIESLNHVE